MDAKTREQLAKVNPQAYHQYMQRQRKRAANKRQYEQINRGYSYDEQVRVRIAKAHADHENRFISHEEKELDRRMAHDATVNARKDAESARQARLDESRAAAFRAEQERQEQIKQDNLERIFLDEFQRNDPYRAPRETPDYSAGQL